MKYYLSLLALFFTCNTNAQITLVDTPHCLNHVLYAAVTGGIIPTPSGITVDDGWSGVIPIGFTYNFYGTPNTQCIIGSNGCLGFNLGYAGAYNTWPISASLATNPSADIRNVICGPWCDVYIPSGGTIDYSMQGTAPLRNFAVTWCGTAMYSCWTEWLTTQIIIYETTGIAEVHIQHRTICLTGWNSQAAIVGVKNAAGTVSTVAPGPPVHDYPTVWSVSIPEGWRFTPIAGPSYAVTSIPYAPIPYAASGIYWYDSATHAYLGTGSTITVVPTVPTTYEACALGCNDTTKAFILVLPPNCFHAVSNSPCIGDTLKLGGVGDSVGATYSWTGPGGFTSTAQYPFIYPCVWGDTGMYYVTKTVGTATKNDSTHVVINPLPVVIVVNNSPLCAGQVDTLVLSVTPFTAGETFRWVGPTGFTSTLQFPNIPGFTAPNVGTYMVYATTAFGCVDSASTYALLVPPPPPPPILGTTQYCYGYPYVPVTASGIGILWYTSPTGAGSTTVPTINTSVPGTYTIYATQQVGSCVGPMDSIKITVYQQLQPNFGFTIQHYCDSAIVNFTNLSANSFSYTWDFGDGTASINDTLPVLIPHTHTFAGQGIYSVKLTTHNPVCDSTITILVDTRHSVTSLYAPTPDTVCFNNVTPVQFVDGSTSTINIPANNTVPGKLLSYAWDFGDGNTNTTIGSPTHIYNAPGAYITKLTVTDSVGCKNTSSKTVYVLQINIKSFHDTTLCLANPLTLHNVKSLIPPIIENENNYNYSWNQSSPNLNFTDIQVPDVWGFGTFTDILTITLPAVVPDGCPALDTFIIHSVLGQPLNSLTVSQTILYGSSIQLNAGNEVYYYWTPNDGSLSDPNINNPIATPVITTLYTVYGYDVNNCLDSANILVKVDSTMLDGVPSGFTPNGDGINDVFRINKIKFQNLVEFRIFNRWGQEVFYTNNADAGWDGTYHGAPQDIGVYNWLIIVGNVDGTNKVYKGDVTLIR